MNEKLDRYQIVEEIGQGGFATVYRAHDTELDRQVAVKELKPILLQDKTWVKRFRREARAIAQLDHARIITVYDVIQPGERLLIVMRLVDGPNLDELITARGGLPWPETVAYLSAIAEGLDYAHSQDILHRDLKPANILMDPVRGPMLSDFGLAKLMRANSSSVSVSGSIAGTPHYIAPEIWEEKEATPKTDIYALGCILYEMLTGTKIFKGETPPAVMMAHFKPLELPEKWPEGVPPGVAEVLRTALAQEPADRYTTAGNMVEALTALTPDDVAEPLHVPEKVEPEPLPSSARPDSESSDYGDMRELVRQATQEVVAQTKREQAAMWRHEAESSLSEDSLDSAERAARKWQELYPDDPEFAAFWQKLQEKKALAEESKEFETSHLTPAKAALRDKKRNKVGCMRKVVVAVILLLALIGALTVLSRCGKAKDHLSNAEVDPPVTENVHVPLLDSAEIPALTINFLTGKLSLSPGAEDALLDGQATYNAEKLKPQIVIKGNQIDLEHEGSELDILGLAAYEIENEWNMKLGSVPMKLDIKTGIAEGDIELGNLSLVDLNVTQGASRFDLSFSEPNQVEMSNLFFQAGASDVTLTGLPNARAKEITFIGGAGHHTLDFSGELKSEVKVNVELGLGVTTIIVPENIAARVSFDQEEDEEDRSITAIGTWQKSGDQYVLPGEGPEMTIIVKMGAGSLTLRNP
jgi:serine/threonine protein kinase